MDQTEPDRFFAKAAADAHQQEQAIVSDLQALALEIGPERLFTTLLIMLCLAPEGTATESTHGTVPVKIELLAFHMFPLFGNIAKSYPNPQSVERALT